MNETQSLAVAANLQSLTPDPLIHLFELDTTPIGDDSILTFHNGGTLTSDRAVSFKGTVYTPMPIEIDGIDYSGGGEPPRPKMVISDLGGFLSLAALSLNDLVGATLTRRRTWPRFLDGSPEAAPVELDPDIFTVERKVRSDGITMEFELGTAYDLAGVTFPLHKVTSAYCPFTYRGPRGCRFALPFFVSDAKGNVAEGMRKFRGPWNSTNSYAVGDTVSFLSSGYQCVFVCLTAVSGAGGSPSANPTAWRRTQRSRGEFSASVTDYVLGDVVYRTIRGVRSVFISNWSGAMPSGIVPPSPIYWTLDACPKFLASCEDRFDPLRERLTLNFGGFPGTVNLPTR